MIRGPRINHIVVRLAAEGLPVYAISRALNLDRNDVRSILLSAKKDGQIKEMPLSEWPEGSRFDKRTPAGPAVNLSSLNHVIGALIAFHGFTNAEAIFAALLLEYGNVATPTILGAITLRHGADPSLVKVQACHLRKKLRNLFGVKLVTVWGRGYALADEDRAFIQSRMTSTAVESIYAAA